MSKKPSTSRRTFVKGTAATAAIAPFFIGRSAKAAEQITWKGCTVAPKGTGWEWMSNQFRKKVKEQTGDALKVKIIFGGGAGGEGPTLKACRDGRMDVWAGSMGMVGSLVSELGVYELPYMFSSAKQAHKVLNETRTQIHDILWKNGFKLVMFAPNGYRSLGTKFPVETPADLKGRKIRVQESKIHKDLFDAWGASGVQMGITEVLSSLQTGVIDGFGNSALFTQAAGLGSGITHWTMTQHIYQSAVILISAKSWNSLPAEVQNSIQLDSEDMLKIQDRGTRRILNISGQLKQNFSDMGIAVSEPDLGPWRKASGTVIEKFRGRTTKEGIALLDAVQKAT